jgi:hypothetical protein
MDIKIIEQSLNAYYDRSIQAKKELFVSSELVLCAENDLKIAKAVTINSGVIDGKNETIREAQLRECLKDKYDYLESLQKEQREAHLHMQIMQLELDRWKKMLEMYEYCEGGISFSTMEEPPEVNIPTDLPY